MTSLVGLDTLISADPRRRGGQPIIAGTGVTVVRIADLASEGLSADQIVAEVFDGHLTLAQVHAALACYFANQNAVDGYVRAETEEYEQARAQLGRHARLECRFGSIWMTFLPAACSPPSVTETSTA
jgi:uncharacterized protein (DUF433 family)